MSAIFIFIILAIILYFILFNNRDKSKDYQFQRHPQQSKGEIDFTSDLIDMIDEKIKHTPKNITSVNNDLINLENSLIADIDNICSKYKIDSYKVRLIIDTCITSTLSKHNN